MSDQKLAEPSDTPLLPKQPEVNIGSAGHVDHGKCLGSNQYVLLDGMPQTGKEILERISKEGKLIGRVDGGEVYEFQDNRVVSVSDSFEPIVASSIFYVQDYSGPMFGIRTKTGRSISITPAHPLLVNREGRILWVKARELRLGDHVAFLSVVPLPEGNVFPDPFEALKQKYEILDWKRYQNLVATTDGFRTFAGLDPVGFEALRMLAGLTRRNFAHKTHMDWKTWKGLLNGSRPLTNALRSRLNGCFAGQRLESLGPGEFLVVKKSAGARPAIKLRDFGFDNDIAKWFAFVWSEGSSGHGNVNVTQTEEMGMLEEYLRITKEKLGQRVLPYGGAQYDIHSVPFVDFLRFKFGFQPGNKYQSPISPWVCRLSWQQKATFLRWFFSLDGEFNNKAGQISIAQANERNIVMLSYLLASFGIVARFGRVTRRVKAGYRLYTRLSISGRRNLELFGQNIGFESTKKRDALTRYLARIHTPSKDTNLSVPLDVSSLRQLMRKTGLMREGFDPNASITTMKRSEWYKAYESLARTHRVSRTKLLLILQSLEEHLDRVSASMDSLTRDPRIARKHLELTGMSLVDASDQLGMGRRKLSRILQRGNRSERITITDFLVKATERMLWEVRPALDELRNLASTPLEFDAISTITVENYDGKVFDLTVPEHSNFVAGMGALVSHNTTTVQSITGVWASAHSEELKRGITIKVGYADAAFYRCSQDHGAGVYSTSPKCPIDGRKTTFLRAVSFVDTPGHESLMTNMLAGAFLMDGALLVIAANEPVPKPQTREHLQALQMLGMKRIVIAQNKIDLVTDAEAKKNYSQIEKFVQGTVAKDAPIVPISAQQRLNIDALIEAIEEVIPTPKRDADANPLMYVVRSFDVNRPGAEIPGLSGGVLGGSLTRGELRVGEEIELRPGMIDERSGKFVPVITRVSSLQTGAGVADKVGPGGLVAVGTHLDPTYTKGDQMVGSVIGKPGTLPETLEHVTLDVTLLETAVGSAELVKVDKVRLGETVRLNLGTASTLAVATSVRGGVMEMDLKKPVSIEVGMRAAMSRRIAERWRLIGSGVLK